MTRKGLRPLRPTPPPETNAPAGWASRGARVASKKKRIQTSTLYLHRRGPPIKRVPQCLAKTPHSYASTSARCASTASPRRLASLHPAMLPDGYWSSIFVRRLGWFISTVSTWVGG